MFLDDVKSTKKKARGHTCTAGKLATRSRVYTLPGLGAKRDLRVCHSVSRTRRTEGGTWHIKNANEKEKIRDPQESYPGSLGVGKGGELYPKRETLRKKGLERTPNLVIGSEGARIGR